MTKRKPTIISTEISTLDDNQSSVIITMHVDDDILDFSGHFSGHPLLPGVTQVDWAIYYGQQYLQAQSNFKGMEVLKFQEPILPNTQVELELKWVKDKEKLYFSFSSIHGGGVSKHSSGRILLGQ
ncbi:3-hydroxyacyl-ACP dehydratase [Aliivibrio sp. 1S165]|jgi:3-hydroxymyristoyl/3-hydroxydecanoyl-(acyl carrier protein) dehydratase|uniref:ApeI family dehydratase n=1 Tax=unclassified Aliivibrio TaxID=2645654 RepID=UPI00080DDD3F|nr:MULTISPECIES: 3-hydroxyacyl-ACP dehydratase [unclassified Aliivibrio]OCH17982.1 3-hydroxyacyl-ACP dehydratase [Aliivibrio sp. 1S165]OCH35359.1 3-hydroxyacyl-ACP dehydratase [Aliivibrio sp. 1S175]